MIERAEARVTFPFEIEISDKIGPNRRPIKAVLFRSNVRSILPPHGSDKPVVIDKSALRRLDLSLIVGLPLHATPNLDNHWVSVDGQRVYYPVGTITVATFTGDAIVGSGFLWDLDHPEIVQTIIDASNAGQLAVSWEIVDVLMRDEGDYNRIFSFVPVGWALLRAPFAAYQNLMPALAAIANRHAYDPAILPLKTLLDDHRLLHAYYATLRRGGQVADWTLADVVKLHAAIVDELILRHVQHRRGEGISKTLNEESLPLQSFQFFSDEASMQVQDILTVPASELKQWLRAASEHRKIKLDSVPNNIPRGVPIAIATDDGLVYAIGAVISRPDGLYLAIPHRFKVPLSVSEVKLMASQWQSKLKFASQIVEELPETVIVPGYIAVTGSSLLTPNGRDLDLLICDNGLFRRIAESFGLESKLLHITVTDRPAGLAIPIYDLILIKRPRPPLTPLPEQESLVEHQTITTTDPASLVAARMRSLGDLDIYPESIFVTDVLPIKRGLLIVDKTTAELQTDEGESLDFSFILDNRPESCLYAVAEVWLIDDGWAIADCLWWNATKVADLPFPWRLSFVRKLSDAFGLPVVPWKVLFDPAEVGKFRVFVLQDSQSVYGAARLIVAADASTNQPTKSR